MELVTLEDNFRGLAQSKGLITSSSPSQSDPKTIGYEVPHFTWMQNDAVLYDALGSSNTRTPGSAFGLMRPDNKTASGIGVFRTKHNRPVIVVTETFAGDNDNPMMKPLTDSGVFGLNPERIKVERYGGGGYIEERIFPQFRETDMRIPSVIQQLTAMENQGPSNRPIVVTITGRPTTWRRVGEISADIAKLAIDLAMKYAAPYANEFLGINASDFLGFTPMIQGLVDNKPVDVTTLATAAGLVLPKELRGEVASATAFYQKVQRGDYAGAAQTFGINTDGVTRIMKDFAADTSDKASKSAQAVYIMDTINQVRGSIRSGTAKQEIINFGTITKTPALQNMLLGAMSFSTAAVPKATEVAGLMASETQDLQTSAEWRGMMQIAHGTPITPCSMDAIALRGLVERARTLSDRGFKNMNMPDIVPSDKRDCFADEIRKQTGMSIGNSTSISTTVALLGVAGAAGIAYFAMRK